VCVESMGSIFVRDRHRVNRKSRQAVCLEVEVGVTASVGLCNHTAPTTGCVAATMMVAAARKMGVTRWQIARERVCTPDPLVRGQILVVLLFPLFSVPEAGSWLLGRWFS
jgi:hypothetical protein